MSQMIPLLDTVGIRMESNTLFVHSDLVWMLSVVLGTYISLSLIYNINCSFSPELLQDSNRDFSVYILDPLESLSSSTPNPSSSSSPLQLPPDQLQQHPRGVAVGLGLMSWVLLADEDTSEVIQVTGTVMTLGNGEEALEVIFALREVGLFILFYSWFSVFFRHLDSLVSLLYVFLFIRRSSNPSPLRCHHTYPKR